jgi:hypothetical protein
MQMIVVAPAESRPVWPLKAGTCQSKSMGHLGRHGLTALIYTNREIY